MPSGRRERKTTVVLFSLFCVLGLFVTFVGIFFRGPGYSFVIPYLEFFSIGTPRPALRPVNRRIPES